MKVGLIKKYWIALWKYLLGYGLCYVIKSCQVQRFDHVSIKFIFLWTFKDCHLFLCDWENQIIINYRCNYVFNIVLNIALIKLNAQVMFIVTKIWPLDLLKSWHRIVFALQFEHSRKGICKSKYFVMNRLKQYIQTSRKN